MQKQSPFKEKSSFREQSMLRDYLSEDSFDAILKTLIKISNERIDILCGGGLRSTNISEIKNYTKAKNFHSSGIVNGILPDAEEIKKMKSQI